MHLTWLPVLPRINVKTIAYKAWLAGNGAGGGVGNERFASVMEEGVKCISLTLPRTRMTLICSSVLNV